MQSKPLQGEFRSQRERLGLPKNEQSFEEYWKIQRKNLEAERIHQLALAEEERRASEVDEEEEEVLEDEESFSDAEEGVEAEQALLSEGVIKDEEKMSVKSGPEEDKPRRFMQEQMTGKEK